MSTGALHSCNKEQKLQETCPSPRKIQLKICVVKAMRGIKTFLVLPCET